MGTTVAANKRFLDTSLSQSARDWDQVLDDQVDLLFADELAFLRALPEWIAAARVIDAGCGNGSYLAKLAAFFPDKDYLGVDLSPELTGLARHRHPSLPIVTGDFFQASVAPADLIVMRFLVQHLGDFGAILRRAKALLRPGGSLIVVEADLARSQIAPLPSTFLRMLVAYNKASAADGGIKGALLADPAKLVASSAASWSVTEHDAMTARIGPFAGGKLIRVFEHWVDLAERSEMFVFDFAAVRAELAAWGEHPASFVSLATRFFVLKPAA